MAFEVKNLFSNLPADARGEAFATLFENSSAKVVGIVSHEHSSPPGFWYDQADVEWVIVLRGGASLELSDGELVELKPGDYLTIPRHVKHRIARTGEETIWLSVHMKQPAVQGVEAGI